MGKSTDLAVTEKASEEQTQSPIKENVHVQELISDYTLGAATQSNVFSTDWNSSQFRNDDSNWGSPVMVNGAAESQKD